MKVLVEDQARLMFVTQNGEWTHLRELAHDFGAALLACEYCKRSGERNLNLYIAFDDPKFDVRLDPETFRRIEAKLA